MTTDYAKRAQALEDLTNFIEENTSQNSVGEYLEEEDLLDELWDTSTVTIEIEGRKFQLSLQVEEI